jgi:general secretion pathway protein G
MAPDFFSGSPYFCVEEAGELDWLAVYPMHTLARLPAREARLNRQAGKRAFTLIELLTVIGIIAILAAITFGVVKGVNERAAIGQAKAELAVLSQALESYKLRYGDYPQTTSPAEFLQSLIGRLGPKGDPMTQKALIDISKFSLSTANADPFTTTTLTLYDPWGRNYLYYYYTTGTAPNIKRSYFLFSPGPNGTSDAPSSGVMTENAKNLDNIYANQ